MEFTLDFLLFTIHVIFFLIFLIFGIKDFIFEMKTYPDASHKEGKFAIGTLTFMFLSTLYLMYSYFVRR